MLEKTLESLLDCKEIKLVNPKKKSTLNIHWKSTLIDAEAEAPIFWPPELKSQLIGKELVAGKD